MIIKPIATAVLIMAVAMGCEPREVEDPTTRVWTDEEKGVNCWYVRDPSWYRSREVDCIPIMEVGGYYEESR